LFLNQQFGVNLNYIEASKIYFLFGILHNSMIKISIWEGKSNMSHRSKRIISAMILIMVLVTACGNGNGEENKEGAEAGKALFEQSVVGGQPGCVTCHSREAGVTLVGPSLATIGSEAGERVADLSAEEYLRQSILEPDAFVVSGFPSGTMPKVWGDVLSEEQIGQLLAYLVTLK
jgi:mono/diheme cytochrome c family protein